jgi:hypothetical protein
MFEPPGRRGQTSTLSWSNIELIVTQADNVRFQSRMLGANGLDPFHAAQHGLKKEVRHNGVDIGIINGRLLGIKNVLAIAQEKSNGPHRPCRPISPNLVERKLAKIRAPCNFLVLAFLERVALAWTRWGRVVMTTAQEWWQCQCTAILARPCVVPRRAWYRLPKRSARSMVPFACCLAVNVDSTTSLFKICRVGRPGYGCCRCPPYGPVCTHIS